MRISLKLEDGTEQVHEVASAAVELADWTINIATDREHDALHLHAPDRNKVFGSFVVYHRCANTMSVGVAPIAETHGNLGP
jgi:hypothetical protein